MKILIFTLTLLPFILIAQNPINESYKKDAIDGFYEDFYWNGKPRASYTIANGNLNGLLLIKYINGNISDSINFNNGRLHGDKVKRYKNGLLKTKETFVNDSIIQSTDIFYYSRKRIKSKSLYLYNSISNRLHPFKNSRSVLNSTTYNRRKSLSSINSTSIFISYFKNGEISETENLINDLREGEQWSYYSNGNIHEKYECENDLLHGKCKVYDKNEKLIKIEHWVEGKKTKVEKIESK